MLGLFAFDSPVHRWIARENSVLEWVEFAAYGSAGSEWPEFCPRARWRSSRH